MRGRHFLMIAVLGMAVISAPYAIGQGPEDTAPTFEPFFNDWETAYRIGVRYLELYPDKRDMATLKRTSVGALHSTGSIDALEVRFKQDFAAGNTVIVDGWVLSEAEAALCALLVLAAEDPDGTTIVLPAFMGIS